MKQINLKSFLTTFFALAGAITINAQDGPCYGFEILEFNQGLTTSNQEIGDDRSDETQALNAPDASNAPGGFVSLGVGGSITIGFEGAAFDGPGNDILIYETTFGNDVCGNAGDEFADLELSQDGLSFIPVGTICRDGAIDLADWALEYVVAVRIINSASTNTSDGYDVDGIVALNGCGPVPEVVTACYGFEVLGFDQGLTTSGHEIGPDRSDADKALNEPDASNAGNGFVSLGVGGSITIGFAGAALNGEGDDILIYETSFSGDNCGASDDEFAEVEVSENGFDFISVGTICRDGAIDLANYGLDYIVAIRITNSASTTTSDGYDLDGIVAVHGCGSAPDVQQGDCYASELLDYNIGTNKNGSTIPAIRRDVNNALYEPQRNNDQNQYNFVSLGYTEDGGGFITLGFNGAIANLAGPDIEVVETSWGSPSCDAYREYADVYVSIDGGVFHFAKTICRFDNFVDISDAGDIDFITQVKIVNSTASTTTDGFDVDGVVAISNCIEPTDNNPLPTPANELTSYPNPSEGLSTIVFIPAQDGKATLEVLNMNGQVVVSLFNQDVQAGNEYRKSFDGTYLPNGIYITRLTSGSEVTIDKLMIAK